MFVLVMGRGFSLDVSVVAGRVAAIAEDLVENIVRHFNYKSLLITIQFNTFIQPS